MYKRTVFAVLLLLSISSICFADGVEIPVSFKIFTDDWHNPPSTGNFRTEAQIDAELAEANRIMAANHSEIRYVRDGNIIELASMFFNLQNQISDHFSADPSVSGEYDDLYDHIFANPGVYQWRDDAVNVYIYNHQPGYAGARWPGLTDPEAFVIFGQFNVTSWCGVHGYSHDGIHANTLAHELGHRLIYMGHISDGVNLMDGGALGEELTQDQLDDMSIHLFQFGAWDYDVGRFFYDEIEFVDATNWALESGSFVSPWNTIQEAITQCDGSNDVIVVEAGTYHLSEIDESYIRIVPRSGTVTILPGS